MRNFIPLAIFLIAITGISTDVKAKTYRYDLDSLRTIIDSTSSDSIKINTWSAMVVELMCQLRRTEADSVLSIMKEKAELTKSNRNFFKYYAAYADYYLLISRHDSAIMMFEKADDFLARLDTSRPDVKKISWRFYYKFGYVYAYVNKDSATANYLKAEKMLGKILHTAEDSSWYIRVVSGLAINYQNNKNYNIAINYTQKGMALAEAMNDDASLGLLHNIMAELYTVSEAFDEAILHYRKGIHYAEAAKVDFRLNQLFFGLGNVYYDQNKIDSALACYKKSLFYARDEVVDVRAPIYSNLIKTYCDLGKCGEAKGYVQLLEDSIEFKEANYEHFDIAKNLGHYYVQTGNISGARKMAVFLKPAMELQNTWSKRAAYYSYMYELSKAENNYKDALEYFRVSELYDDSINQQKIATQLTEVSSKYEAEKKDNQIQLLKKDNDLQQASAERQKLVRNYAFGGIGALLLFGGFTYYRYRQRKKLSEQLGHSLQQLETTQQQVIKVEKEKEIEKLRVRISRDIHDDIGSHLSQMALQSELISSGGGVDDKELRQSLQDIAENSRTVINSLGEIVWAVSPNQDSLQSLLDYMRSHLDKFLKNTGTTGHPDFPVITENRPVMPDVKRNLYLIFKEAVNNAIKYAQAKNIWITFTIHDSNYKLVIRDDGKGFEVSEAMNKGNGLNNMQERMKQMQGTLRIESAPGKGCTITVLGIFN